jgi:predicted ester cyclase
MMAPETETARAVVTEYFDALAAQDLDRAVATWKPGSLDRLYGFADMVAPDGIRDYFAELFAAIPEFRLEVRSMVTEGDQVAVHWRASGTFDGDRKFQGFTPNGRPVELEGLDLLTVEDGRIVSNYAYTNGMEFARQVGAMPARDSAAESAMAAAFNAKTALEKRLRGS